MLCWAAGAGAGAGADAGAVDFFCAGAGAGAALRGVSGVEVWVELACRGAWI